MFLIALVLTLLALAILDGLWLGTMTGRLYRPLMGSLLADKFNMVAAVAFYLMYGFGVTWFLVFPALNGTLPTNGLSAGVALTINAALLGLLAYGTYNLTALAVIRDWSLKLTLIDTAWGMVITTASAHAAVMVARLFRL
ncbi:DUF2177 family protein [Asticcacaulis sp. BYS171W]|uniref:DUF2177 family protein n=1 Tax=Asticcacaulis aquaticus TaxID=2984212 RepID=A0ABT5HV47_9CAUL|nr:DUF2177 family protein [Asticcacaulis aquaticus]MDC7683952.1 DUF2177 family protein [Asticcacaulis aquaticus]